AECVQPGERIVTHGAAQIVTPGELRHRPCGGRDEKRCSDSKNEEDAPAKFRAHPCSPTQVEEPYHTGLLELDRVFHLATRRTRLRGQPARFDLIRPLARSLLVDSEESSVPVGKARRDEMIGLLVCASAADADLVELRFGGTTRMLCVAAGVP